MHQMIFVNLPVADLEASRAFFTSLGYTFNEQFCDGNALCLELGGPLFAMLLHSDFFATFHDRSVADAHTSVEALLCVSVEDRAAVDRLVQAAVAAGGTAVRTLDEGFMYGRSYADLDGHIWEIMWMDAAAAASGCPQNVEADTRAAS